LPEPLIEDIAIDPVERAVFLLHEAFGGDYAQIGQTLGRSEAACRQLASRARSHVQEARPRVQASHTERPRAPPAAAVMQAAGDGDWTRLGRLLAGNAAPISDGEGKRKTALRDLAWRPVVFGLIKASTWRSQGPNAGQMRPVRINGAFGVVIDGPDGASTIAFEPTADNLVGAIHIVRNPDSLKGL
jgi:RNA polymerase sigma-70 factor (ECF subfamily)